MLKIKDKYKNKYISNQGVEYFLSEELNQQELIFILKCVSPHVIEQVEFKGISLNAKKSKRCKGSKEFIKEIE